MAELITATSLRTRSNMVSVDTLRGTSQPIRDPAATLEQFRAGRFEHVFIQAQPLKDRSHLGFVEKNPNSILEVWKKIEAAQSVPSAQPAKGSGRRLVR